MKKANPLHKAICIRPWATASRSQGDILSVSRSSTIGKAMFVGDTKKSRSLKL